MVFGQLALLFSPIVCRFGTAKASVPAGNRYGGRARACLFASPYAHFIVPLPNDNTSFHFCFR